MINLKKNRLKYLLWILSVALASLYIHCMIYFPLDPFRLSPTLLVKIFFIAIICNLGLAFVTFDIAKIYKKIATLLFIPSLTITPAIVGLYFIPGFLIMLFANIFFFIKLNPWRKDEMGSTST